jgi:hypothetical protein
MRPFFLLAPLVALLSLAPSAHANDPVAAGFLTCGAPGVVDWDASASDVDGDLVSLVATVRSYATQADCQADLNVLQVVEVARLTDAAGSGFLDAFGTLNGTEGSWCHLVVEALDLLANTDEDASACCLVDADPDAQILVRAGDPVPAVGVVEAIDNLTVDDDGNTLVQVDTDNPDFGIDTVVLRNGHLLLQQGQALPLPTGATLKAFDTPTLNTSLHSAWVHELDDTGSFTDDVALYFGDQLLLQEGGASSAPQLLGGNVIKGLYEAEINNLDHMVLITIIDEPGQLPGLNIAVLRITVDAGGNLASETLILRAGDFVVPGVSGELTNMEIRGQCLSFNDLDQFMFVTTEAGSSGTNRAVYIDGVQVARDGSPSPVPGRPWDTVAGAEVDLNNLGDWVLHAELEGDSDSDYLIEKSGAKFIQEGDTLPAIPGFVLQRFGFGPVFVGDNGNVLWFGDWDDPDTSRDSGLFLNHQLILQEGVSVVDGELVEFIRGVEKGYVLSPDGEWVVVEVELAGGVNAAVLIHVGPWTYLDGGSAGTGGITPRLRGGGSLEGDSLARLELSSAKASTTSAMVMGLSELSVPFRGGILVPNPDALALGLPVDAQGESHLALPIPVGLPPGLAVWFQAWIQDPGGPFSLAASNAVKGTTP